MSHWVYMLECADGTLYTGWTTNLERRMSTHNSGQGARYTRGRRPVHLVYWEACENRRTAQQREAALRRIPRAAKLALIAASRDDGNLTTITPTTPPKWGSVGGSPDEQDK